MDRSRIGQGISIALAGTATGGALVIATYLLFAEVTTVPGSTQPATGLESGSVFLLVLAIVPVLLSGIGFFGAYRQREWLPILAAAPILVVGVGGFGVGFYQLIVGLLLLASAAAMALSPDQYQDSSERAV